MKIKGTFTGLFCTSVRALPPIQSPPQSNPAAAKQILVDVGLWTLKTASPSEEEEDGSRGALEDEIKVEVGAEGGGEAATRGVIPWPKEALEAAAALTEERARRARKYDGKASKREVGAPASFGRCEMRQARKKSQQNDTASNKCTRPFVDELLIRFGLGFVFVFLGEGRGVELGYSFFFASWFEFWSWF